MFYLREYVPSTRSSHCKYHLYVGEYLLLQVLAENAQDLLNTPEVSALLDTGPGVESDADDNNEDITDTTDNMTTLEAAVLSEPTVTEVNFLEVHPVAVPEACSPLEHQFPKPLPRDEHMDNKLDELQRINKPRARSKAEFEGDPNATDISKRPIVFNGTGFLCRYCGSTCTSRAGVTVHERIHTGEKPFICPHCPKGFRISCQRKEHIRRMHNKLKPFKCKMCNKCFKTDTDLRKHWKRHSGKDIPCSKCEEIYSNPSDFTKHMDTVHPEDRLWVFSNFHQTIDTPDINEKDTPEKEVAVSDFLSVIMPDDGLIDDETDAAEVEESGSLVQVMEFEVNDDDDLNVETVETIVENKKDLSLKNMTNGQKETVDDSQCEDEKIVKPFKREFIIKTRAGRRQELVSPSKNDSVDAHTIKKDDSVSEKIISETKHFKCDHCEATFASKSKLVKHIVTHKGNKLHKCLQCEQCFKTVSDLKNHTQNVHGEGEKFECVECDLSFKSFAELSQHKDFHESNMQKCPVCDKSYTEFSLLMEHAKESHDLVLQSQASSETMLPVTNIKAEMIDEIEESEQRHKKRKRTGTKQAEAMLICHECGVSFPTLATLNRHMKKHKIKTKPKVSCSQCDRTFERAAQVKLHMDRVHNDLRYQCPECNRWYTTTTYLALHMKHTHSLNKIDMHQINVKTMTFSNEQSETNIKKELVDEAEEDVEEAAAEAAEEGHDAHEDMQMSSEENGMYQCPDCPSSFIRPRFLRKHCKSEHDNDRPFACGLCDKRFVWQNVKSRHIEAIHGEKEDGIEGPPYNCKVCGILWQQACDLRKHMKTHQPDFEQSSGVTIEFQPSSMSSENGVNQEVKDLENKIGMRGFPCEQCGKTFTSRQGVDVHQRIHTGELPYKCEICEKAFRTATQRREHVRRMHTNARPYICTTCGMAFKTRPDCSRHEARHQDKKPHSCSFCKKQFVDKTSCSSHERRHTGEKPFSCQHCTASFPSKSACRNHEKRHFVKNVYPCSHCNKVYSTSTALQRHIDVHNNVRAHPCTYCNKCFFTKTEKVCHEKRHLRQADFQCQYCQKTFYTSTSRKLHEYHHTGEKPYTCNVCGRSFSSPSTLQKHKMIHTDVKPYTCKLCGQAFRAGSTLQEHMVTHGSDKPRQCLLCGMSFAQRSALYRHKKTHHPGAP